MKSSLLVHTFVATLAFTGITGCNGDGGSDDPPSAPTPVIPDPVVPDPPQPVTHYQAIIATVSSGFDSSAFQIVDLASSPLLAGTGINSSADSDITVSAYGSNFYRIGRYDIDTISKYSVTNPAVPVWQYSAKDDVNDTTANPYKLVFLSETKAYLLRYGSSILWVVNPSAATEADFKIGEIDLSAYDEGDGTPEMNDGVIVDGKLFVTLERQFFYDPSVNVSYVAVIDTATDTEIETNADSSDTLKGIPLHTHNAGAIVYQANVGLVVDAIGDYGSSYVNRPIGYLGGIEVIDPATYTAHVLIDDGDDNNHPYGLITNVAIVSDAVGYFTGYAGWQDMSIYRFSPTTGIVDAQPVAQLSGIDIRGLTVDPQQRLWVSVADDATPHIDIVDTVNNVISTSINTQLNPTTVVFTNTQE